MAQPTEEQIAQLFAVHNSPERRQTLLARQYGFDSTRTWVDDNGYRLSDRVWRSRLAVRRQIDQILRDAIANGTDALEITDILEQFLDPEFAPVRNAAGKLIRNQAKGIVTEWPGRSGFGSFAARRLARTEITRALGMSTIETARRTPFATGIIWRVSGRHPKPDECDDNADRSPFKVNEVPRYPAHPQCLCTISIDTEPDTDKIVESLRQQYGLDQ